MSLLQLLLQYIGNGLSSLSWVLYVIGFIAAFMIMRSCWGFWREESYKHRIKWVQLEIKIPREVLKGPKAMEQFFQAIQKLSNKPGTIFKKWWDGEICRWHVIDIVGKDNAVRFFFRTPDRLAPAVEGLLYANYPEVEIVRSKDPLKESLPPTYDDLHDQGFEIFGNELYQVFPPAVSIRTYSEFEQESGDEKGRIIDPFAVLMELVGNLKPQEMLLVQMIIQPDVHKHWIHEADHLLEKLRDTTQQLGKDKEGNPQYRFRFRTPHEDATIKRIEDKLERGIFETTLRYMYVSPKEDYNYNVGYRGIQTFFNQFRHDRQILERNLHVMTKGEWYYFPWIFPDRRLYWKRVVFYDEFMRRFLPEETLAGKLYNSRFWQWCLFHKPMPLSTEELATLFHIPTNVVLTSSTMERMESKKLSAPHNLPSQ